jgi:hypothetical protein
MNQGGVSFLPDPIAKGGVVFGELKGVIVQAACLGRLRI